MMISGEEMFQESVKEMKSFFLVREVVRNWNAGVFRAFSGFFQHMWGHWRSPMPFYQTWTTIKILQSTFCSNCFFISKKIQSSFCSNYFFGHESHFVAIKSSFCSNIAVNTEMIHNICYKVACATPLGKFEVGLVIIIYIYKIASPPSRAYLLR